MSKFSVKVKLKELEIEVEGSREDVPRLAQNVGEQVGNLIKPALLLEAAKPSNGHADIGEASEPERRRRGRRSVGGAAGRTPGEEITVSIDPATHGSPRQEWKTAEKAIWFLYVVRNHYGAGLTAHSIAKGFNKHFKSAGAIIAGNVGRDLEKERLKGTGATVGADTNDGAAKYYLTDAGIKMAEKLIRGDAASAATAS